MKILINNLEELEQFAKTLTKLIQKEDVISLVGNLGAGKTTLVQMIGNEMGIKDNILSPTFSIINIYNGRDIIYHLDLYRLEDPSELEALDYETYFYPDGITFIEWARQGQGYLPEDMIEIKIEQIGDKREIEILENSTRGKEISEQF